MRLSPVNGPPAHQSPSDKLFRNEVEGFLHALDLVLEMCDQFQAEIPRTCPLEEHADHLAQLLLLRGAAHYCRRQYLTHRDFEQPAMLRHWGQHWNVYVRQFGQALESWDYSDLAI